MALLAYIESGVSGVNPGDGLTIYPSFTSFLAAGLGAGSVYVRDTASFTGDYGLSFGVGSQQFYPDPANTGQVQIVFPVVGIGDGFTFAAQGVAFLGDNTSLGGTQTRGFRFVGGRPSYTAVIVDFNGSSVRDCDFDGFVGRAIWIKSSGAASARYALRCDLDGSLCTITNGAMQVDSYGYAGSCRIVGSGTRGVTVGNSGIISKVGVQRAGTEGIYVNNGGYAYSSWTHKCNEGFQRLSAAGLIYNCATGTNVVGDFVGGSTSGCIVISTAQFAFVDEPADDCRILGSSLCKDAGTNTSAPSEDFYGTTVPQDGTCDIGYHEFYDPDPPIIVHTPISDGVITGTATNVDATITDVSGVGAATLYYRTHGAAVWNTLPMAHLGGGLYRATIPGVDIPEGVVDYYIEAEDTLSPPNVGTDPAGAPSSYHDFGCAPLTALDTVEVLGHNKLRVTFTEKFAWDSVFNTTDWSVQRTSGPTPENVVGAVIMSNTVVEVFVNGGIVAPMSYSVSCPGATNPYGLAATLTTLAFTVTPSMVASVFASAALADEFIGLDAETDVLPGLIYPMLPEGLRTIDQTAGDALVERLLWGAETEWSAFQQRAWRLRHLYDYRAVPVQLLDYLLALVGFGSGAPGRLAALLSEDDKRRLASVAALFWKRRGREDALSDAIRVFASGIRPAIDTWFDLRFVVDEVEMGMTGHPGLDPWVLSTPTAENTVYLRVPDLGGMDRNVVEGLARIARPINEVYEIAYVDFLDTFVDGIQGHWERRGSVKAEWQEPYTSPTPSTVPHVLPGLLLVNGCSERVSVPLGSTWTEYLWGAYALWKGTGNDCTLALRFYVTDDDNRYEIRFSPAGTVQYIKRVAGLNTLIKSVAIPLGLDGEHGLRIEVEQNLAGNNAVRVYLDQALVLFDDTDNAHSAGTIEVGITSGTNEVVFQRTELYQFPLATTTLTG